MILLKNLYFVKTIIQQNVLYLQYKMFCIIINLPFINKRGVILKIKSGFELVNKQGQHFIVSKNSQSKQPDNAIVLNDTAVFLWNLLKEKEVTKAEMLNAVIENFDISTVLALGDIDVFVRTMKENGIIE